MKLLSHCPACKSKMAAKSIFCPQCGLEAANNFELSCFDYLSEENEVFLKSFLKARGNLKVLQEEMKISYPTAKKRLEQLIDALELDGKQEKIGFSVERFEKASGTAASTIVRNKLISSQGKATVYSYDGTAHDIFISQDGNAFTCKALPNVAYEFRIFDYIVNLLLREGGRAKKGQARGKMDKVGSEKCNEHTVTGVIALDYYGKSIGDSVFDPVFVLAGILEWADIAKNGRGYLELTSNYKALVENDV